MTRRDAGSVSKVSATKPSSVPRYPVVTHVKSLERLMQSENCAMRIQLKYLLRVQHLTERAAKPARELYGEHRVG